MKILFVSSILASAFLLLFLSICSSSLAFTTKTATNFSKTFAGVGFPVQHLRKASSVFRNTRLKMSSVRDEVNKLISENTVMVFSKTYCPYCTRAKEAIAQQGVTYKVIELDRVANGEQIQSELLSKTGQRTVPNVFVKGNHVGGCDKTLEAISNGNFRKLLNA